MLRPRLAGIAIAFLLGLALWPGRAAAQSCRDYYAQAEAAAGQRPAKLDLLDRLRRQVQATSLCREDEKTCFAFFVADAYARRAAEIEEAGGSRDEAETLSRAGFDVAKTWRTSWTLAHFAERRKDFDRAALLYKSAITTLADAEARIRMREERNESFVCPGEKETLPTRAEALELIRLSAQADALSRAFVPAPPTRSGAFGGIFVGRLRDIEIDRFPVPVEFQFGSDMFTDKGLDAARFLAEFITRNARTRNKVVLTGHADRKGSDEFNCKLSARRLAALIRFLRANGVGADVAVEAIPQGKGEPFPIVEGSNFTQEEIDQINRRIELRDRPEQIVRRCPA